MRHDVKIWREWFDEVVLERRPFEVRIDDREPAYAVDDELLMREWDPEHEVYTGGHALVEVTYVMRAGLGVIERGISAGYAVMGINLIEFHYA